MNDLIRWLAKAVLSMIVWVFILSIRWNGTPVFHYAHDLFVRNTVVRTLDAEIGELWWRLTNKSHEVAEKAM